MVLDLYQQQFFENVIRFHDETAAMPALMILRQVQVRAVSTPSFSYKLPYDAVDPTSQNREADLTVQITSDQLIKAWPVLEAQDLRDLKRLLMVWSRQVSVGDCSWDPAPEAAVWICLDPQTRPGTQRAETAWSYKGLYQGRDVWVHSARFATAFQEFLRAPARTNRPAD